VEQMLFAKNEMVLALVYAYLNTMVTLIQGADLNVL
jgi:hypothetical protein